MAELAEQLVARRAHNPKVAGSSPVSATIPSVLIGLEPIRTFFFCVHTASAAY